MSKPKAHLVSALVVILGALGAAPLAVAGTNLPQKHPERHPSIIGVLQHPEIIGVLRHRALAS